MVDEVKQTVRKPWYTSKTVWFNILTVGGAVAGGVAGFLPAFQPFISPLGFAVATTCVGVVNIVLRSVTSESIWITSNSES